MKSQKLCIRDVSNQFNVNAIVFKARSSTATPFDGKATASSNCRMFGTNKTPTDNNDGSENKDIPPLNVKLPTSAVSGIQRPNRFTSIYSEMQRTCQDEIEAYAKCVMMAQQQQGRETMDKNVGTTTYHVCAAEFAPVKECFRTVRQQLKR
jgi:hypothetical protein